MNPSDLRDHINAALEDLKGVNIVSLDVSNMTSMTDYMILVSGNSNRHVKALVDTTAESAKAIGVQPLGVEGRESYEWVLVDLCDILVHVMNAEARTFYDLERLWTEMSVTTDSETAPPPSPLL